MYVSRKGFISDIHDVTGYTKHEIEMILDAIRDITVKHLRCGDSVRIFNGLTITATKLPAHNVRLPDGSSVITPTRYKINARIGDSLKESVN